MKITLIKKDIKQSLDARWRKTLIILFLLVIILGSIDFIEGIIKANKITNTKEKIKMIFDAIGIAELFLIIVFGTILIYQIYQYCKLFKKIDKYEIFEVMFDKVHQSYMYKRAIYFTVTFKTASGKRLTRDTYSMFSNFSIIDFPLEDYTNKLVKIAYNEVTDSLIVLGNKFNKFGEMAD